MFSRTYDCVDECPDLSGSLVTTVNNLGRSAASGGGLGEHVGGSRISQHVVVSEDGDEGGLTDQQTAAINESGGVGGAEQVRPQQH